MVLAGAAAEKGRPMQVQKIMIQVLRTLKAVCARPSPEARAAVQ
jgi:hypothetical protein